MVEYVKHKLVTYAVEETTLGYGTKITSSTDINRFIREVIFSKECIEAKEYFYAVILNNANKIIGYHKISEGGIAVTVVDIRLVVKYAIENLATAIILTHNHPAGSLIASAADKQITKKLCTALSVFDIKVLDHIIASGTDELSYFSFADELPDYLSCKYNFDL